jgi:heme A synthase
MNCTPTGNPPVPRWLHWLALATVVACLPLALLGAEVTTKRVGMVDEVGFRPPWYLLTASYLERGLGYLIEHSHRFAGYTVGFCTIILAIGLLLCARHGLVRWMGVMALAAVGVQGLLGGFRVNLNAWLGPSLALIHGCFAQVAFAILVSTAVMTSSAWGRSRRISADQEDRGLRRLALLVPVLVYGQIVLGAFVRHFLDRTAQRLHVLVAFVAALTIVWLAVRLWQGSRGTNLRGWSVAMLVLLGLQLLLGVEAWMGRFGAGTHPEFLHSSPGLDIVRSGHFVIGTFLFAATVVVALLVHRVPGTAPVSLPSPLTASAPRMEGAA